MLSKSLIHLTEHFLVKSNKSVLFKLKTLLNELIEYLEVNNRYESENIIKKISVVLKSLIYLKLIKSYHKKVQFKQIMKIYFEDKYIKSILIDVFNHNMIISSFYNLVTSNRGINIIKGGEDIKAIVNHHNMLNYKTYNTFNLLTNIRFARHKLIPDSGFHLSYFGDVNFIKTKVESFAESIEYTPEGKDINYLKTCYDNNILHFNKEKLIYIPLKDNLNVPVHFKNYVSK
jgi:hypothetical protein